MKVVAKDPIAYARNLLDLMFTKKEQRQSLLLPTSKSSKPPLDQEKVTKLFGKYTMLGLLFRNELHLRLVCGVVLFILHVNVLNNVKHIS